MLRKLTTSVAASALFLSVAVAPAAFAQETTQPQPSDTMTQPDSGTGTMAPSTSGDAAQTDTTPGTLPSDTAPADTAANTPATGAGGYLNEQAADQIASSTYVGQTVYNSADEGVGSISDLIFQKDGGIQAAVIGVGGFLGIGQKNVAVPFENIAISEVPNSDDLKLTTTETAESLKAAPEFKTKAQQVSENNASTLDTSTTSSTTGTGTVTAPAAPAENN